MINSSLRAITTRYKGYAFRSRLEARWAVFFDHLGIRWEYEPEGFELGNGLRYLPDFWLPDLDLWVEVKPDAADDMTKEKAKRLLQHTGKPIFVTGGMPDRNGVLFFQDISHDAVALPAFGYWKPAFEKQGGFLVFGDRHSFPEHRCRQLWVHADKFDHEKAEAGARLAPGPFADALYAARGARFEFGEKGGAK